MIETLCSSRSAIWLNCSESARSSVVLDATSSAGTRDDRSPSASRREASVRRVRGVVKRCARNAATSTATPNAIPAITRTRPVIAASVLERAVYGLDKVTTMPHGGSASETPSGARAGEICGSRAWPRIGATPSWPEKARRLSGSGIHVPSVSWVARPNMTETSASATLSAAKLSRPRLTSRSRTSWLSTGWPSASSPTTAAFPTLVWITWSMTAAVALARPRRLCSSCWRT